MPALRTRQLCCCKYLAGTRHHLASRNPTKCIQNRQLTNNVEANREAVFRSDMRLRYRCIQSPPQKPCKSPQNPVHLSCLGNLWDVCRRAGRPSTRATCGWAVMSCTHIQSPQPKPWLSSRMLTPPKPFRSGFLHFMRLVPGLSVLAISGLRCMLKIVQASCNLSLCGLRRVLRLQYYQQTAALH